MSNHLANKQLTARFLAELADTAEQGITAVLERYCHPDCRFEIFHPFNRIDGLANVAEQFWAPLKRAFPDYEQRLGQVIAGEYEGREQVSTLGYVLGTFDAKWLTIPPTHNVAYLRFALNVIVRDGKFAKAYVMLDIPDLMRQAGFWPLREMPGSAEQWPLPPMGSGATLETVDSERGVESLRIVREMQLGLPPAGEKLTMTTSAGRHSPHWHDNMNWYGPAGIGSARGLRGFREFHGALFLKAFPDRSGIKRDETGPEDGPGHYTRLGDGPFAVTSGWPSIYATHTGGQWLGLPPSGRKLEMRVGDWYLLDRNNKITDNWVMIDIPHMLDQMGLDILDDLRFFADRSLPRLGS
ncbi:MAG: nuclear transport factor 2 family protein [Pseudomonadota bacterium]